MCIMIGFRLMIDLQVLAVFCVASNASHHFQAKIYLLEFYGRTIQKQFLTRLK